MGDTVSSDISAEDIIGRVANLTNVRAEDIVGPSRRKEITEARHLSVYLCRDLLGLSLATIWHAFWWEGPHHSVVRLQKSADRP